MNKISRHLTRERGKRRPKNPSFYGRPLSQINIFLPYLSRIETGLVHDGDESLVRRVHQFADDAVVEVLDGRPLDALAGVLLLLLLQHQLWNGTLVLLYCPMPF